MQGCSRNAWTRAVWPHRPWASRGDSIDLAVASEGVDRVVPTPLALLAAVVLAGVLVVAAAAKLRRPQETIDDFAGLGLPWPGPLATVVPLVEIGCAVLLIVVPGWGGVAAFGLLATFTAVLATVIRSGRVTSCACFGARGRDPVSVRHLIRNAVLGLMCLAAATIAGPIWAIDLF